MPPIRALVFDVFGTVVDWRGGLIREGQALGALHGIEADWAGLADAWRAGYHPAMARVRAGELPWTPLDGLHRQILDGLLPRFGLQGLSADALAAFTRAWHRLDPWPDVLPGLRALHTGRPIAPLSNGNVALLLHMARRAGLPWDTILSAEMFGHYKPDAQVYLGAARWLAVAPAELMMVAAHPSDLRAAARCGLRTAYVPRPLENGPGGAMEAVREGEFDTVAHDFVDLARQLGD